MDDVLIDPSDDAVNMAAEAVMIDSLAFLTGLMGGKVHRDPDMLRFVMGVPVAWDNGVAGTRIQAGNLEVRIDGTIAFFEAEGVPWSWRVGTGTEPPELDQVLADRGFWVADDVPRMAIELDSFELHPSPDGLQIIPVTDASSSEAWANALNEGFGMRGDLASTMHAWARAAADDGRWVRFVGMADGLAVSTSGVYLFGGVAGVVQVATIPGYRRRGFAEALTAAALAHARARAYRIAALGSSDQARRVYSRMGFREVGRMKTYLPRGVTP
jgi:ribosomal protein S18 acetylase RimI-like enzyme